MNIKGDTNSAIDFVNEAKNLIDLNNIDSTNLKDMFVKYCELLSNDDIQLRHYFTSQSNNQFYSDYMLSYLLEGLEGFSNSSFSNEITFFYKNV